MPAFPNKTVVYQPAGVVDTQQVQTVQRPLLSERPAMTDTKATTTETASKAREVQHVHVHVQHVHVQSEIKPVLHGVDLHKNRCN